MIGGNEIDSEMKKDKEINGEMPILITIGKKHIITHKDHEDQRWIFLDLMETTHMNDLIKWITTFKFMKFLRKIRLAPHVSIRMIRLITGGDG